jgi:predicted component of type VI protein secretion system
MIDAEKLLAPIAADAPAGRDLRAAADDRTHRAIKEQRAGGEDGDPRSANWTAIRRQCEDALAAKSKGRCGRRARSPGRHAPSDPSRGK